LKALSFGSSEREFRAKVVLSILDGKVEFALKLLSEHYGVNPPDVCVGTVKRHRKVLACYLEQEKRIYVSKSDLLTNPFLILHEFYHHLRASQVVRGQVDKRADHFASHFLRDFRRAATLTD